MTNEVGLLFWPPLAGNRNPITICSLGLYPSLAPRAALARVVDADELHDWCEENGLGPSRFDGDYGSIVFPDDDARVHFKLRWW